LVRVIIVKKVYFGLLSFGFLLYLNHDEHRKSNFFANFIQPIGLFNPIQESKLTKGSTTLVKRNKILQHLSDNLLPNNGDMK